MEHAWTIAKPTIVLLLLLFLLIIVQNVEVFAVDWNVLRIGV